MKKIIIYLAAISSLLSFAIFDAHAFTNIPHNNDGFSHSSGSGHALPEPYLKFTAYDFAEGVNGNTNSFFSGGDYTGGVFDGANIWMVPSMSDRVVKIDPASGRMTGYELAAGTNMTAQSSGSYSNKFMGGAYAGGYIWLFPHHSDRLVRVNPANGAIEGFDMSSGTNMTAQSSTATFKYWGGAFDGTSIWLAPYGSDRLAKISDLANSTPTITGYAMANGVNGNSGLSVYITTYGARFSGAVFDGANVWLVPRQADQLVRVDPATGAMTGFDLSAGVNMTSGSAVPSVDKYFGGVFDGANIWIAPMASDRVLRIGNLRDPAPVITGFNLTDGVNGNVNMSNYTGAGKFRGCVYDGKKVWLVPANDTRLVSVDPADGRMTGYRIPAGRSSYDDMPYSATEFYNYYNNNSINTTAANANAYRSGVYDGRNIWLMPSTGLRLLKVSPSADLTCLAPFSGNLYRGDAISFKIDNYMGAGSVIDSVECFMANPDDTADYSYKDDFDAKYDASAAYRASIDRPGNVFQMRIYSTARYWVKAGLTDASGEKVAVIKPFDIVYEPQPQASAYNTRTALKGTTNYDYLSGMNENSLIYRKEEPSQTELKNPVTGAGHSAFNGTALGVATILAALWVLRRKR